MPASPFRRPRFLCPWILPFLMFAGRLAAQTTNPYESEIRAFEAADLKHPPATNSILFLGSSSIRIWTGVADAFPDYAVLNRGFGGSQASDVLFFFDRLVPPYRPPLVVFYEGDNDLAGGKSVDTVFADWTNFVARVKAALPTTDIMFLSVKPSPSRAQLLGAMRELNDRVRRHCESDPQLRYADVFTPMLNASGQPRPELFGPDNLHLNAAGYALWQSVVGPALDDWAADYPLPVKRPRTGTLLVDFGGEEFPSGGGGPVEPVRWNNVTSAIGASASGTLATVMATDGTPTGARLRMVSRFNGANENGTVAAAQYPASATRDSLFGNTEAFGGLSNVTPVFRLAGLDPATACRLTFYASRLAVGDNRETRYTVTGSSTHSADLNAAGNVEAVAVISDVLPDSSGELEVALTPGPNNSNANHFTYLGVLKLETLGVAGKVCLFDFGAAGSPTGDQPAPGGPSWNNLTAAAGTSDSGGLPALVDTNNAATTVDLKMVSRFNGANANGTTSSGVLPASATRDSLFGNTEVFNGLSDILPEFRLNGLDPAGTYALSFYASRTGVGDHRETRYTVVGATTNTVDLDAANNLDGVAVVTNLLPDLNGSLLVQLRPGPNNDNVNQFTYLGALRLDWSVPWPVTPAVRLASSESGALRMTVRGSRGRRYRLEESDDLGSWRSIREVQLDGESGELELVPATVSRFFRVSE